MVKQPSDSNITMDALLAEFAAIASTPQKAEWEITCRELYEMTPLNLNQAKHYIYKLHERGLLERRKVKDENDRTVYAYAPPGEDKIQGWKKLLAELK